jgi:hypothetical protein
VQFLVVGEEDVVILKVVTRKKSLGEYPFKTSALALLCLIDKVNTNHIHHP